MMPKLKPATITVKTTLPNGDALYADVGIAYLTKKAGYVLSFFKRHKTLRGLADLTIVLSPRKSPKNAVTHNVQVVTEAGEWAFVGAGFLNKTGSIGVSLDKKAFPELSDLRFYISSPRQAATNATASPDAELPNPEELAAASTSEASRQMSGVHVF